MSAPVLKFSELRPKFETWLVTLQARAFAPVDLLDYESYTLHRKERSVQKAIILRLARVLSGVNALSLLNEHGFCQEQATLQRTIDEFVEDIEFLAWAIIDSEISALHDKFLAFMFSDLFVKDSSWASTKMKGPDMPKRDKIRAFLARKTADHFDQSTAVNAGAASSHVYSGYVHGAAHQVMNMYFEGHFLTNGMSGSPIYQQYVDDLWNYILRAAQAFGIAAKALGEEEIFDNAHSAAKTIEGAMRSFRL